MQRRTQLLKWCGEREIWIVNKKQTIFLWIGIGVFILFGVVLELQLIGYYKLCQSLTEFILGLSLLTAVIVGLMYTFEGIKEQESKMSGAINLRFGFWIITFVLSLAVGSFFGVLVASIPIIKHCYLYALLSGITGFSSVWLVYYLIRRLVLTSKNNK